MVESVARFLWFHDPKRLVQIIAALSITTTKGSLLVSDRNIFRAKEALASGPSTDWTSNSLNTAHIGDGPSRLSLPARSNEIAGEKNQNPNVLVMIRRTVRTRVYPTTTTTTMPVSTMPLTQWTLMTASV